jgi:hypothetical protein
MRDLTLIFFFDFVSFKASTIGNPIDEGEGVVEDVENVRFGEPSSCT